jgi:hypothetical protein
VRQPRWKAPWLAEQAFGICDPGHCGGLGRRRGGDHCSRPNDRSCDLFQGCGSILPKDVLASVQQQTPGNLAPEEWATMVELVRLIKASAFGTSGGSEHLVGAGGASVAMLVTAPQISAR